MPDIIEIISYLFCFVPIIFLVVNKEWAKQSIDEKIVSIGLSALLISNLFNIHQRVQFLCLFGAIGVYYSIKHKYFRIPSKVFYIFFAYMAWQFISLFWTSAMDVALSYEVTLYILFLLIPLPFVLVKLDRKNTDHILTAVFRTIFLFVIISIFVWIAYIINTGTPAMEWVHIQKRTFDSTNPYEIIFSWTNYFHPTYLSISIITAYIIGLFKCSANCTGEKVHYGEVISYSILSLFLIILIQSRVGLINWCVISLVGICYHLRNHKNIYLSILGVSAIIVAAIIMTHQQVADKFFNDPIRIQNLKTAVYCIKQHPVLGSGIGAMQMEMNSVEIANAIGYKNSNWGFYNPHYQFIGDLMQTGIVGLLLSLSFYLFIIVETLKRRNMVLLSFMIAFCILSFTEMPLHWQVGIFPFLTYVCMLIQLKADD